MSTRPKICQLVPTTLKGISSGSANLLPGLARELVDLKPDVLVSSSASATLAAAVATAVIPVVATNMNDAVANELVGPSFARPNRNVTGFLGAQPSLAGKQAQFAAQSIEGLRRLVVLDDVTAAGRAERNNAVGVACRAFGIQVQSLEVTAAADISPMLQSIGAEQSNAVLVPPSNIFTTERRPLIDQLARMRRPAIYPTRDFVADGGLMAYGADNGASARGSAAQVVALLRGLHPAEIPVQAAVATLVLNLKTAAELGVSFPSGIVTAADEVID